MKDEIIIGEYPLVRSDKLAPEESEVLQVRVYYSLGGLNYFTGTTEGRGIYIGVTPIKYIDRGEYRMQSFTAFSGIKSLKKALGRKSPKALQEVAEQVRQELKDTDTYVYKLINHVLASENIQLEKGII